MKLLINGTNADVTNALREHVRQKLEADVKKYFARAIEANVVFSREAHMYRVDISVHAGRGIVMQGRAKADEMRAAFDLALEHIAKQLRRYKRRLKEDHHKGHSADELIQASQYVLAPEKEDAEVPENGQPVVVAEMTAEIATLTVGEAVMRMDLADQAVLMFRNRGHGGLNVVYRRNDGNIGWIDPKGSRASAE
jgi:ribosomal subunit interface protein